MHIPLDVNTQASKGFGFVTFESGDAAWAAFREANGAIFQGRILHIIPNVDRGTEHSSRKRSTAGRKERGTEFHWTSLQLNVRLRLTFLNGASLTLAKADAVADSVAARLNVSKSEVLDPTSSNAAVRLAIAETHTLEETKAYLVKVCHLYPNSVAQC